MTEAVDLQDESELVVRVILIETLRHHLASPCRIIWCLGVCIAGSLPLTPNGKVDRKALPEPDMAAQQALYIAPHTDTEKILCEIWQEVLQIERVGIKDNFFQLGGHSLLATRLVARNSASLHGDLTFKSRIHQSNA